MKSRHLLFAVAAFLLLLRSDGATAQSSDRPAAVASAEELQQALRSDARRIALRRGDYRFVRIENVRPGGTVTIAPADPADMIVINRLSVAGSADIAFERISFRPHAEDAGEWPLADLRGGARVAFRRVSFTVDGAFPAKRFNGIAADGVDGLAVADSRFEGLERAVDLQRTRNASIEHNAFERLGISAVTMAGSSDVTVASNRFAGFRGEGTAHFIHAWTRGATAAARNIAVRSNVMIQDTPKQAFGVMLSNEQRLTFDTVDVSGNVIVVGSPHGITIDNARNVTVTGNVLLDAATSTNNNALRLTNVSDGSVSGNLAVAYSLRDSPRMSLRMNVSAPRLESRARPVFLKRLEDGLAGRGDGRLHAGHVVTPEQRAAGPRP
jgi:hypothetical protein